MKTANEARDRHDGSPSPTPRCLRIRRSSTLIILHPRPSHLSLSFADILSKAAPPLPSPHLPAHPQKAATMPPPAEAKRIVQRCRFRSLAFPNMRPILVAGVWSVAGLIFPDHRELYAHLLHFSARHHYTNQHVTIHLWYYLPFIVRYLQLHNNSVGINADWKEGNTHNDGQDDHS
ncbi:unnamed protein product [Vitrella brassicaformis CCMP3155]|uniref:Uncharacterized protein n=1 Tax=Vitrella brassicaformis (strain CCMP3155) TaxID=1169540 RepID=A0A0G4EGK7_VITBC|nr:unnamed protein product [Vitrella brassicaformis CCMP3155]|eukprot:CEL95376.1 unnamed protein product [Vitrella brassicaformis CCMP3155]